MIKHLLPLSHMQVLCFVFILLVGENLFAGERYIDPDGCFSCHAFSGLQYIDKNGVLRDASLDQSRYASSLHGSVPCKDCHRKIRYYPHVEENGEVDCGDSCHVDEPSSGEAFSHKDVVKEFEDSSHGAGASKGFTGANRMAEDDRSKAPSCRRCHNNSAYVEDFQMEKFKEVFQHTDTECGNCHQGEAWKNQIGGHILRRIVGARWKKQDSNKVCNECHADIQQMKKVSLKDPITGEESNTDYRWQHASASYAKSLHGRLIVNGEEAGASCLDCHAPNGYRHGIGVAKDADSSTHPDNLHKTCGQSQCHEFALHDSNHRFVNIDQHNMDRLRLGDYNPESFLDLGYLESNWFRAFIIIAFISLILIVGQLIRLLFMFKAKSADPIVGSDRFKRIMLGRRKKAKTKAKRKHPNNTTADGSNKPSE